MAPTMLSPFRVFMSSFKGYKRTFFLLLVGTEALFLQSSLALGGEEFVPNNAVVCFSSDEIPKYLREKEKEQSAVQGPLGPVVEKSRPKFLHPYLDEKQMKEVTSVELLDILNKIGRASCRERV